MTSRVVHNNRSVRTSLVTCLALTVLCTSTMPMVASAVAPAPVQQSVASHSSKSGITLSPPFKDITISSGLLAANANITLTNNTGKDVTADLKVVDFSALGEFGAVSLNQPGTTNSNYGLAHWTRLPSGGAVLLPNGKATEVPVEIVNSSDLAPGGHYGALVVTATSPDTAGPSKVSFKQELVSLFFVKKLGGERYGLDLRSFKVARKLAVPNTATLTFKSTGNVHVVPRGYVAVTDPNGRLIAKGTINPESTLIMPGTTRQFITLLESTGSSKLVGRYTVTAHYRYDGQKTFMTKTVYVNRWNIPFIPIIIAIVTGVIASIMLYKLYIHKKSYYHNKLP